MERLSKPLDGTLLGRLRNSIIRRELLVLADGGSLGPVDLLHSAVLAELEFTAIFEPDVNL